MKSDHNHGTACQVPWEDWLERHAPALLLYARQQTRTELDAQDLVQEAIVESWRKQTNDEPPPVAVLYATIRRRAIDLARSADRRNRRETAAHQEESLVWFESDIEQKERTALVQKAMASIPEIYREVITLKVWGGLTFREIAATLNISTNTAASRYRYGLQELRRLTKEVIA